MSAVFVVLGASGGIGSAVARRLAATGAQLTLAARGGDRLDQVASELGATSVALDATDAGAVLECVEDAKRRHDRVDGVINCVGSLLLKPAHRTTPEEWDDVVATNLRSAFCTVRAATTVMRRQGSIVLVASGAALVGLANHEAIASAKAGIIGLARSAAATYASRGVRVNVVAPGLVQTNLTADLTRNAVSAKASRALHPLGRLGDPEDIASAICWLADPAQSWVTGQVLGVDGGLATLKTRAT